MRKEEFGVICLVKVVFKSKLNSGYVNKSYTLRLKSVANLSRVLTWTLETSSNLNLDFLDLVLVTSK